METALDLTARGLSVIPIPRPGVSPGADGKVPAIAWKAFQTRRATEAELRRWFAYDQNVAIVTGAISGLVVVDADSPEAIAWIRRRLPYTPWQTKTARGFHLFYGHPGVPVRN
ncbi:MAG: bifunctional DNA primase/polymerase, partial [Vicinamibacterales bacterium]